MATMKLGQSETDNEVTWREVNGRVRDKAGKRIRGKGEWVGGERKGYLGVGVIESLMRARPTRMTLLGATADGMTRAMALEVSCDVHLPGKDPPVSGSGGRAGPYGLLWPGKDPPVSGSGGRAGPTASLAWQGPSCERFRRKGWSPCPHACFESEADPPASVSRALVHGCMLGGFNQSES
ncbi:hypothetical protein BC829DRAFT_282078 [Chytridium lagenaria]|nr:hypothetical protein BC829DRAFT_282078 [Chytridium lagenaria]